MKRKRWIAFGIPVVLLVCLIIIIWPAAPLWQKMGVKPFCIQGEFPDVKIVACSPITPAMTVTPLPLPTLAGQSPVPIIVDDDGSPDGTIDLLFFLNNPLFDVRAVTVSSGEAHPDIFAPHLAQLLVGLGRADIPVGAGRDTPLKGDNAFPDSWREASDHFWELRLKSATNLRDPVPAARLIVDTITQSSQPVVVFLSGTHTNLAEALRLQPGIIDKIQDVYVMGGSIHVPGNIKSDWPSIDNSVAEWNIWVDPVAAQEVFASGLRLHLVPLDATRKVLWTKADLPFWTSSRSPEGELAGQLLQRMIDMWSQESVFIWDLVAAVQATNPALCPEVSQAVNVVTTPGSQQGRTLITKGDPNVAICLEPDAGQVKALAASILQR